MVIQVAILTLLAIKYFLSLSGFFYSIVKDSIADLGVIFRVVQNRSNCLNQLMSQSCPKQTHQPTHTGSSWADFNHGLIVRPRGTMGVKKSTKYILQIDVLSQCANIWPILNKLQKTSRSLKKGLNFGRTSQFLQFGQIIRAINFQIRISQVLLLLQTPIRPLVAYNQRKYLSFQT